jgi:hypothetical protein
VLLPALPLQLRRKFLSVVGFASIGLTAHVLLPASVPFIVKTAALRSGWRLLLLLLLIVILSSWVVLLVCTGILLLLGLLLLVVMKMCTAHKIGKKRS